MSRIFHLFICVKSRYNLLCYEASQLIFGFVTFYHTPWYLGGINQEDRQCSNLHSSITRFNTKSVTGIDNDLSPRPVTGHVLLPCLNHSLIAALSKVWPVSRVTGSLNKWPVKRQTKSFGIPENTEPWSMSSKIPDGSALTKHGVICSATLKENNVFQTTGGITMSGIDKP